MRGRTRAPTTLEHQQAVVKAIHSFLGSRRRAQKSAVRVPRTAAGAFGAVRCVHYAGGPLPPFDPGAHHLLKTLSYRAVFAHPSVFLACALCGCPVPSCRAGADALYLGALDAPWVPRCAACAPA